MRLTRHRDEGEHGAEALEATETDTFDLVITDINMPVMGGIELTKNLRSSADHKYVPIVLLTAESDPKLKQASRDAGASGWLTKPFTPEKLLSIVERYG